MLIKNIFKPNLIEAFTLKRCVKIFTNEISGTCLDVGCGSKPYAAFFSHCESYIGLEVETEIALQSFAPEYFYDGTTFPFAPNSFDSLVSFEVLEHVKNPDVIINEIIRVLKPGGKLIISVPFCWIEHEKPYDYRRYTKTGLEEYLKKNGFEIILSKKTTGGLYTTLANFILVLRFKLRSFISYFADVLLLPVTILLHAIGYAEFLLHADDDSYTSTIILASLKADK